MSRRRDWQVGDRYFVHLWSSGERIWGKITEHKDGVYTVEWDDGQTSQEREIRPAEAFWET